jgi:hypothetical protein
MLSGGDHLTPRRPAGARAAAQALKAYLIALAPNRRARRREPPSTSRPWPYRRISGVRRVRCGRLGVWGVTTCCKRAGQIEPDPVEGGRPDP